jgi:hypothetical protein
MIANGGTINYSGKCHSINVTTWIISYIVEMGGVDVVSGVQ